MQLACTVFLFPFEPISEIKLEAETPEKEAVDAHKAAWEAQLTILKEEKEKQRASQAFDELDADGNEL